MIVVLQFLLGLAFLIVGAELLVRGASALAISFGIAPVVIGLTVVSVGTSSPELAIAIDSSFTGRGDIALGNIIGSNIANVLLILGISALIAPLVVHQQLVRLDVPVMVGVSLAVVAVAYAYGSFNRIVGLLLLAGFVAYVLILLRANQDTQEEWPWDAAISASETEGLPAGRMERRPRWQHLLLLLGGLLVMVLGADWLVEGASTIARELGVSELVIGLTIVAVGTSAPELATSVVAVLRGQRDIAVGNIIGSNVMNLLLVLGATALFSPAPIKVPDVALAFDLPFMLAVALACLPVFFAGYKVRRWEGMLFLGYYIAYLVFLLLLATEHDALPRFNTVMLYFVVPLTVLALGVSVLVDLHARRRNSVA